MNSWPTNVADESSAVQLETKYNRFVGKCLENNIFSQCSRYLQAIHLANATMFIPLVKLSALTTAINSVILHVPR